MKLVSLFAVLFFSSCSSDVSIMKRADEISSDTSGTGTDSIDTQVEETGTDTNSQQPTDDPPGELTVGFIEYSLTQASCPACFGIPNEITTVKYARFHEPTGGNHYDWVPRVDEFCRNYYESPVNAANVEVGNTIILKSQSTQSYLNKIVDGTGTVYQEPPAYTDGGYLRDNTYEIWADDNKLTDDNVKSLHGFDYVEPYTMLYVDPSYAFQTPINKTNNYFTWGPSGDSESFFTIHISVYSQDGTSYYGTTICRGPDTGSLVFPGSYFSSYPTGSLTSIHLIRHRTKDMYSAQLDGVIQTHVWWEVIGTGFIQ